MALRSLPESCKPALDYLNGLTEAQCSEEMDGLEEFFTSSAQSKLKDMLKHVFWTGNGYIYLREDCDGVQGAEPLERYDRLKDAIMLGRLRYLARENQKGKTLRGTTDSLAHYKRSAPQHTDSTLDPAGPSKRQRLFQQDMLPASRSAPPTKPRTSPIQASILQDSLSEEPTAATDDVEVEERGQYSPRRESDEGQTMCGQEDHAEHHIDDPDDGIPHNSHPMLEEVDDTDGYRRPLGATMKLKLQLSTAGVARLKLRRAMPAPPEHPAPPAQEPARFTAATAAAATESHPDVAPSSPSGVELEQHRLRPPQAEFGAMAAHGGRCEDGDDQSVGSFFTSADSVAHTRLHKAVSTLGPAAVKAYSKWRAIDVLADKLAETAATLPDAGLYRSMPCCGWVLDNAVRQYFDKMGRTDPKYQQEVIIVGVVKALKQLYNI